MAPEKDADLMARTPENQKRGAYQAAGVDIELMNQVLLRASRRIRATYTRGVATGHGAFGGAFHIPAGDGLLVASMDGVGTKLKVAVMAGKHDTVGRDLVNHCVNDILTAGAQPLFFLDYIGTSRLDPVVFDQLVTGLCRACRDNACALLGGETAEMPGLYPAGEYDLVGCIIGWVQREKLVTGRDIRPGDVLVGLPSSGLHTNGYSLARKILFQQMKLKVSDPFPGLKRTVAEVLLSVHRSYLRPIRKLSSAVKIRGMAHITGGGLIDNVPRMLPANTRAVIQRRAWRPPTVFRVLQEAGKISHEEMYRVFNMGIGYVVAVHPDDLPRTRAVISSFGLRPIVIGRVEAGKRAVIFED